MRIAKLVQPYRYSTLTVGNYYQVITHMGSSIVVNNNHNKEVAYLTKLFEVIDIDLNDFKNCIEIGMGHTANFVQRNDHEIRFTSRLFFKIKDFPGLQILLDERSHSFISNAVNISCGIRTVSSINNYVHECERSAMQLSSYFTKDTLLFSEKVVRPKVRKLYQEAFVEACRRASPGMVLFSTASVQSVDLNRKKKFLSFCEEMADFSSDYIQNKSSLNQIKCFGIYRDPEAVLKSL